MVAWRVFPLTYPLTSSDLHTDWIFNGQAWLLVNLYPYCFECQQPCACNSNIPEAYLCVCVWEFGATYPRGPWGPWGSWEKVCQLREGRRCLLFLCPGWQSPLWGSTVKLSSAVVSGICSLSLTRASERWQWLWEISAYVERVWVARLMQGVCVCVNVCECERESMASMNVPIFTPGCLMIVTHLGSLWADCMMWVFHLWARGSIYVFSSATVVYRPNISVLGVSELLWWGFVEPLHLVNWHSHLGRNTIKYVLCVRANQESAHEYLPASVFVHVWSCSL